MTTVHIVLNAHLDPIWLWSWRAGLDEALNSTYYICAMLDRHPDIIYTRGESWLYDQIRRVDPVLFERVRAHIKAGRWSTVGGWYIQPDCNLPSGFAMKRQIELGRRQFREFFGDYPKVAYNVDSFGHSAALPDLMRKAGQQFYVMMRPQKHEMKLPASLFRWRGHTGGEEVITFRTPYYLAEKITEEYVRATLCDLPEGVTHTMCFAGVGDHGGGPTEEIISWCREHRTSIPGAELVFSSPEKFFSAIQPEISRLPEVVGEMQMHAVGCYTMHRPVKVALRQAEHRLAQAESAIRNCPPSPSSSNDCAVLEAAWERVCFHHFHDTMGGTCLPSAFRDVDAQLGAALTAADEVAAYALRRRGAQMAEDPAQRIVCLNASDRPFDDYLEVEPWLEWTEWQPTWRLVDENNQPVPEQRLHPEANADTQTRLLFALSAKPGELRTVRIVESGVGEIPPSAAVTAEPHSLQSPQGPDRLAVRLEGAGTMDLGCLKGVSLPALALYDDPTDTWSHNTDRYARENKETPLWEAPQILDKGPLMASLCQQGTIGRSELQIEWRLYLGKPWVECLMRVHWMEKRRILKFEWDLPGESEIAEREDGIMNGSLIRKNDGCERPFRDWVRLRLKSNERALDCAVIAPEVFGMDTDSRRLGLTLLRSPAMAWEIPNPVSPRAVFSDRGEHFLRFRFLAGENLLAADLDQIALAWQRPMLTAEVTRGMRNRSLRGSYTPPRM